MASAVKKMKHSETPKKAGTYHRLVCLTGKNKGIAYYFIGKRVVLGRGETVDVQVLDLKSSREHAEITLVGNGYILTDLGSQNGVVINDLKVKQHSLNTGDKVIIGQTVYKFSKIEIAEEKKEERSNKSRAGEESDEELGQSDEEDKPKNKRMTMILGVVALAAILLILSDDTKDKPAKKKRKTNIANTNNSIGSDNEFETAIKKQLNEKKESKKKLNIYFKRGLREFREGNFFRAIAEFEHARQWSPNDPVAKFYLRKTKEALDETITAYFNKATRDIDALKYMKASTSYCAVLRLLHQYESDERYKTAEEGIDKLEVQMGLEKGAIKCSSKLKRKKK